MKTAQALEVKLEAVERYERDVKLRLAFRFGVITMTEATQAVVCARISLADGRGGTGVAAEMLAPKWFDKNAGLSDGQNLDQLRQAIDLAVDLYRTRGMATPFALFADTYRDQSARGAALKLNPLVSSYGPALLDRAIIDALGRTIGRSFADVIRANLPGIAVTELTPDLNGFDLPHFLASLEPGATIDVRHTVGLVDPITAEDQTVGQRIDDGLPETLEEVARHYGCRYYKLKVGGNIEADLERLTRIAAVLDRNVGGYRATLDGNEQYDSVEGIAELWRRMTETPALKQLLDAILFIEQPIKRGVALSRSVDALAHSRPLIIDESDGELESFPVAVRLGYAGVSSKNCKGFYKSLLNAARVKKLNTAAGSACYFMSGEDLTTWAGVSVQQDLALVSLLGLTHVERNGHHFIDGMSFAPEHEQRSFVTAHSDLYTKRAGPARLRITDGKLRLGSLGGPGFAVAGEMDFASMRPMPDAPKVAIVRRERDAVGARSVASLSETP
jgi:hypothetical protein